MIKNSKQNWTVGQSVNVGFLKGLLVLAAVATPGDYAPDCYVLARNTQYYKFTPHTGLEKLSQEEAEQLCVAAAVQVKAKQVVSVNRAADLASAATFQARMLALNTSSQFMGHDAEGLAVYLTDTI